MFFLQFFSFFFFNDTATTEIYTLSLHDALPISAPRRRRPSRSGWGSVPIDPSLRRAALPCPCAPAIRRRRSEEHTSELQSPCNLVCRLLLEKKKQQQEDLTAAARDHKYYACSCT